jgi:hypothetical protein
LVVAEGGLASSSHDVEKSSRYRGRHERPDDDDDELTLRADDHVELKEDGTTGRVVGPSSAPGRWKLRLDESMAVE